MTLGEIVLSGLGGFGGLAGLIKVAVGEGNKRIEAALKKQQQDHDAKLDQMRQEHEAALNKQRLDLEADKQQAAQEERRMPLLQNLLERADAKYEKLAAKFEDLADQNRSLAVEVASLSVKSMSQQEQLAQQKDLLAQLRAQLESATARHEQDGGTIIDLRAELNETRAENLRLENSLSEAMDENERLEAELEDARATIVCRDRTILELQDLLDARNEPDYSAMGGPPKPAETLLDTPKKKELP